MGRRDFYGQMCGGISGRLCLGNVRQGEFSTGIFHRVNFSWMDVWGNCLGWVSGSPCRITNCYDLGGPESLMVNRQTDKQLLTRNILLLLIRFISA